MTDPETESFIKNMCIQSNKKKQPTRHVQAGIDQNSTATFYNYCRAIHVSRFQGASGAWTQTEWNHSLYTTVTADHAHIFGQSAWAKHFDMYYTEWLQSSKELKISCQQVVGERIGTEATGWRSSTTTQLPDADEDASWWRLQWECPVSTGVYTSTEWCDKC